MRNQPESTAVRIYLHPFEREVKVLQGTLLIDALRDAGIHIESICGGKGLCKKCKVILNRGECSPIVTGHQKGLTPQEIARGYFLACRMRVNEDCEITIPVESRINAPQILLTVQPSSGPVNPAIGIYTVDNAHPSYLPFPTRPVRMIGYTGPRPLISDELYRCMANENATIATVSYTGEIPEVIAVESDEAAIPYGLAIDLGTTTIVCLLVNLRNGNVVSGGSAMNRQITYGEEVISRIAHASKPGGLSTLQQAAVESINDITGRLSCESGIPPDHIRDICVGGNTVMNYLLTGTDPLPLELANAPISSRPLVVEAQSIGLDTCTKAKVYCLPNVSRFLGGDAVGDVLTSGMHKSEDLSLLIDMGTNGEIILGNCDWLTSASCASGPAFEGGGILHGMRAMRGAIDHVEIDQDSGTPTISVIGELSPRGICGSGIIDTVRGLFKASILDFTGRLVLGAPWVREGPAGMEYLLVPSELTQIERDIVITQQDMAYIMDSKAAVCGAISVLMKKYRIALEDVCHVFLAGAFGTYVNPCKLVEFGIIPAFSCADFKPIGNGSLSGAYSVLVSQERRKEAEEIARKMVYIDLLTDVDFMEEYTAALYIPGKKELFP
ncbi:MAG: ASKHA domain-containing protein [Methanomicrobiales archaeon]|nr:ASKHA domain-containing protein [Methanomicrobiales archaeon]